MPELKTASADEAVVRHYLMALNNGQVLDALNAFSMDAQMRDERGRERRGIREIAAAFASREPPVRVDVEDLEKEGESVSVRLRMTYPESREPRVYRSVFRVSRDRIHSLEMDPVPSGVARKRRTKVSS